MFGLSLSKILLLAAVVFAVWYGLAWLKRLQAKHAKAVADDRARDDAARRGADLSACPACGTFVAPGVARCPSGRADCPMLAA